MNQCIFLSLLIISMQCLWSSLCSLFLSLVSLFWFSLSSSLLHCTSLFFFSIRKSPYTTPHVHMHWPQPSARESRHWGIAQSFASFTSHLVPLSPSIFSTHTHYIQSTQFPESYDGHSVMIIYEIPCCQTRYLDWIRLSKS